MGIKENNWVKYKDNIYRRRVGAKEYEYKYRVKMKDGVGQQVDTWKKLDDKRQPFRTLKEAEAHRKAFVEELLNRTMQSISVPNLHTITEIWADYEKNRACTLSTNSMAKHDGNVRNHIVEYFGKKPIGAITIGDMKNFMASLKKKGLAPNTIIGIKATMEKVWGYAEELGIISRDFYIDAFSYKKTKISVEKPKRKRAETFKKTQLDTFIDYVRSKGTVYYVLFCLTYYGGVRVSEALGLTWKDILWSKNEIIVRQQLCYDKYNKGNTKRRTYIKDVKELVPRTFYASPVLMEALKEWKSEQEENERRFGKNYKNKEVLDDERTERTSPSVKGWDFILRLEDGQLMSHSKANHFRAKAQKELGEHFYYHGLRHTVVTNLSGAGVPIANISKFIGHADTRTTEMYYLGDDEIGDEKLEAAIRTI